MTVARGKGVCSIEGCTAGVLARGWCGRHYSRWQRWGDPTFLYAGKREPDAPAVESRRVGKHLVSFTEAGDAFVMEQRTRRGQPVQNRRYGTVLRCEACNKEAFIKEVGGGRSPRFCSPKCASPANVKVRRKKKPAKTAAHADSIFSKLVRLPGVCENCGATERLQCAHGFSRRYRNVRWTFENAFCLCAGCHMYFTYRPLEWEDWMRGRLGDEGYDELRRRALETKKVDVPAVLEWLIQLHDQHREQGGAFAPGHHGWTGLTHAEVEAG